jgi:hypothetical protein
MNREKRMETEKRDKIESPPSEPIASQCGWERKASIWSCLESYWWGAKRPTIFVPATESHTRRLYSLRKKELGLWVVPLAAISHSLAEVE